MAILYYSSRITGVKHRGIPAGFTLLELLVSVSVIAMLMGLLIPSLARAKALARRTACGAHVRGLTLANSMYACDNRGRYMLAAEDLWRPNLRRWHGYRLSPSKPFEPELSPFIDYMGSEGLKQCPDFIAELHYSDEAGQAAAFEAGCGGYGYNAVYVGGRNDLYGISPESSRHSAAVEEVVTPTQTVMFTDAAFMEGANTKIAYSFCEPPFWEAGGGGGSPMRPDPTIDFRHMGRTNVAWCDGHVSDHPMAFTVSYQTHSMITADEAATDGLGWFGPENNSLFDLE